MKFFTEGFLSKYDQFRGFLRILSLLLKKSFMENFIFLCSGIFSSSFVVINPYPPHSFFEYLKKNSSCLAVLVYITADQCIQTPKIRPILLKIWNRNEWVNSQLLNATRNGSKITKIKLRIKQMSRTSFGV